MCALARKNPSAISPREIAYLALLKAKKEGAFIADTLELWIQQTEPTPKDAALAREIAYGSCRMGLALDVIGAQCSSSGKLSLKMKERLLLHTALYQYFYLERIPLYAIVNESINIARKHCHAHFAKFLNAALRKLEAFTPQLPSGSTISELSMRHSYPPYFVEQIINAYGLEKGLDIFEIGNQPSPTMLRMRQAQALNALSAEEFSIIEDTDNQTARLHDASSIAKIADCPHVYIQNATPTALMALLKKGSPSPKRLLDLCASPGGKLLLAHDLFPSALLHANDISPTKLLRLQQNASKYQLEVAFSCGPGENFQCDHLFDLIILDVPCSNTGVLNKRPEARWRLDEAHMEELASMQLALLGRAKELLSKNGEIWYLTCSILPAENERLIERASEDLHLTPRLMKTILPASTGWDGGFACALYHTT